MSDDVTDVELALAVVAAPERCTGAIAERLGVDEEDVLRVLDMLPGPA
ncbi:MAG TPA: hypothetical protein VGL93_34105 [Streptosporangiaceae bacterium]|jgi:hypothetical protein